MALDLTTLPVLLGNSKGDECYPVTTRVTSIISNTVQPTACLFYDNGNSAGTNVGARITAPGSIRVNNPNGKLNFMTALPFGNMTSIGNNTYSLVVGPNLALNKGSNAPVNCATLTITYSNTGVENPEPIVGVTRNMNCAPIPSSGFVFPLLDNPDSFNTVQIQVQAIENDVTVNLYQDRGGDALIATFSLPTDNYTYCTNGRGDLYLLAFVEPELVNGNEIEFNAGDPMEDASVTVSLSVDME